MIGGGVEEGSGKGVYPSPGYLYSDDSSGSSNGSFCWNAECSRLSVDRGGLHLYARTKLLNCQTKAYCDAIEQVLKKPWNNT